MNIFEKEIIELLKKETKLKEIKLEKPKPELGDYAFPCFLLAKQYRKNPVEIAKEIAGKLKKTGLVKEIKETGPYVNFFIDKGKMAGTVVEEILKKKEKYGSAEKKKEKIMVEFLQANTHKAVHIGHVRNMCLGIALTNILRFNGYNVISANYQGDIGPHVVKCLWGLMNFKVKPPKENRLRWLGEIYARANKKISGNEKLELEIRETTKKLYDGDEKLTKLWKETRQWCLEDFEKIYDEFDFKFDKLFFESDVEKKGKKIVKNLLDNGIAKFSEGAIVMDLEKYSMAIYLLLRSDGVALYSTKDIALAKEKFEKYKIDRSIYVVGAEQEFYFKQLFKTLELMGFSQAEKCYHLSYGLVMLPEGKMSSREGNIVLYDDLRDKLYESALKGIKQRHSWTKEEMEKGKKSLAFSALKFGMVSRETNKQILFDWDKALDFEGETGPYVQYAHARICSVLKKHGKKLNSKANYNVLDTKEDEKLIGLMSEFPEIVSEAGESYKVHLIAHYLIALAQALNEFYHSCPVLQSDKDLMEARLKLISAVKQVLANGLGLLGIDAPEQM